MLQQTADGQEHESNETEYHQTSFSDPAAQEAQGKNTDVLITSPLTYFRDPKANTDITTNLQYSNSTTPNNDDKSSSYMYMSTNLYKQFQYY